MPLNTLFKITPAHLSGEELVGDNATEAQLKQWYAEEGDAYANLTHAETATPEERSTALNKRHFGHLFITQKNLTGLVLGPADATELRALKPYFNHWYAVEPAKIYQNPALYPCPVTFIPTSHMGTFTGVPDNSVDVVLALSVLHHIPNVSYVLSEAARVLKKGGHLILREPTVTMGDWSSPRPGLTPNERGLPLPYLTATLHGQGFTITQNKPAVFAPWDKFCQKAFHLSYPYNRSWFTGVDALLSTLTAPLAHYNRPKLWQKFAPSATLLIAQKQ